MTKTKERYARLIDDGALLNQALVKKLRGLGVFLTREDLARLLASEKAAKALKERRDADLRKHATKVEQRDEQHAPPLQNAPA